MVKLISVVLYSITLSYKTQKLFLPVTMYTRKNEELDIRLPWTSFAVWKPAVYELKYRRWL